MRPAVSEVVEVAGWGVGSARCPALDSRHTGNGLKETAVVSSIMTTHAWA